MSDLEILMFFLGGFVSLIGFMILAYFAAAGHWLVKSMGRIKPAPTKPHYLHLLK